jgi:hypothetical protein
MNIIPPPVRRPRPTEIWDLPCERCPSAHYPPDSESADYKKFYEAGELPAGECVFPCAWRPEKLCRGVCDYLGVTEKDL